MSIIRYALEEALNQDDLTILKQPIVGLNGYREDVVVKHYEVLTAVSTKLQERYGLSNLGLLIEELEIYEGTGYLDEVVFKTVIDWISTKKHLEPEIQPLYHINIHPDTINYDTKNIAKRLGYAIENAGIQYNQVCFEITENTLLRNLEIVKDMISDIRELGCCIALDDFGKKMLNLSTLKILRPDYVKIDGVYVQGALESEFDRLVIKSIVELSKVVGAKTIAEHIENDEQYELVKELGVDYGQGWYFGRPVGLTEKVSIEVFKKGLRTRNEEKEEST